MPVGENTFSLAVAVTPADATPLPKGPCQGLWINVAGNIQITDRGGNVNVFTVQAGAFPGKVAVVWATNTTASGIIALY